MIGAHKRSGRTWRQRIAAATAGLLMLAATTVAAAPEAITVSHITPVNILGVLRIQDYTNLSNGAQTVVLDNLNDPSLFRPSAGITLVVLGWFIPFSLAGLPTGAALDCNANIWAPFDDSQQIVSTINITTGAVTAEDGSVVATMSPAPLTSSILYPVTC